MTDPVWLDTNTIIRVINGDYALATEMRNMRAEGRTLLMVPAVKNELLYGNPLTMRGEKSHAKQAPSPQSRAIAEKVIKNLDIQLDMEAAKVGNNKKILTDKGRIDAGQAKRVGYAMQDHVPRPRNLAVPNSLNNISESDSLVLSQIKASAEVRRVAKPQIFTAEGPKKAMVTQAHVYGIDPIRPKTRPPGSGGGGSSLPPKIELADYPADAEHGLARFFKDRAVLKQAGLMTAHMLASQVGPAALQLIKSHYAKAISEARREFDNKAPDPTDLWLAARIDEYRRAYETAQLKLRLPSPEKLAEQLNLLRLKESDREAAWQKLQERWSQVKLPNGAGAGYHAAEGAYIKAMAELYGKYSKAESGLIQAADNIQKRADALEDSGDELDRIYWQVMPFTVAFPPILYTWLDVQTVAETLQELGRSLAEFTGDIRARNAEYVRLSGKLDEALVTVSNDMGRYAP